MASGTPQPLTAPQIAALNVKAGFKGEPLVDSIAVALAESSGRYWVTSPNPDGGTNAGLFQLDTPGGAGAGHTVQELLDPQTNADVAYKASGGGRNWSQWATWPAAAQPFLGQARAAAKNPAGPGVIGDIESAAGSAAGDVAGVTGIGDVASAIGGLAKDFDGVAKVITWLSLPSHWTRIFAGVTGAGFLAAGIYLLGREAAQRGS